MTENDALNKSVRKLLFAVRRSRRYHQARRRFFDRWNTITNAISFVFGSVAIYTVLALADKPIITILLAATVSLASVLNFVFGTTRKARLHHDLARDFITLESRILGVEDPTHADLKQWTARRHEIEANELPVKEVLDILMHNKQALAQMVPQGQDIDERIYHVSLLQHALAQYVDVFPDKIVTVKKRKELKAQRKQSKQLKPA